MKLTTFSKLNTFSSLISAALLSMPMLASATEPGTMYLTPFVGAEQYSSNRHISRTPQYGIGAEMYFTEHLGGEIDYMRSQDARTRDNDFHVNTSRLSIDGVYSIGRFGMFEPYLKAGAGLAEYNFDNDVLHSSDVDAGGGVRFHFTDSLSARLEAKALHELNTHQTHGLYTLGIGYSFGTRAPEPAPAPVAAVAPPPAAPLDSDGDGVIDDNDKCPNTPAGREVDENGCEYVLRKSEEIRLDINFATNKADIGEAYIGEVEKAAKFLKRYSHVKAEIAGHTDSTGKHAHNQTLSQRRAEAVRDMLVQRFDIDASRLTAVGYAETQPIASNKTAEGKAQNRRVVAVMQAEVTEDPNPR